MSSSYGSGRSYRISYEDGLPVRPTQEERKRRVDQAQAANAAAAQPIIQEANNTVIGNTLNGYRQQLSELLQRLAQHTVEATQDQLQNLYNLTANTAILVIDIIALANINTQYLQQLLQQLLQNSNFVDIIIPQNLITRYFTDTRTAVNERVTTVSSLIDAIRNRTLTPIQPTGGSKRIKSRKSRKSKKSKKSRKSKKRRTHRRK